MNALDSLTGIGALIRLALRRDRIILPIWIVCAGIIPIGLARAFAKLYPTPELLKAFADQCMSSPAVVAMLGPIFAPTVGGLTAWRTGAAGMLACGITSLLIVIRHTRAEEEAGPRELLSANVVGRHAALSAALIVTLGANLALATFIALGLIGLGLPISGAFALGLSWAAAGWIFAAVAALAAQLSASTSTARNLALSVFGVFFVMRVAGDSGGEHGALAWMSLLSPLGWTRLTRPFGGERWSIFALVIGFVIVVTSIAFAISARRDLGAGLFATRSRPGTASAQLRTPLALAWRLQRGMLTGWTVGFALIGLLLGAVGKTLTSLSDTPEFNGWVAAMGAHDSAHAFLRVIIYVLGQTAAAYAILAALRMRTEEAHQRAEPVLATSISRLRWASSHIIFAGAGPAAVLFAAGVAMGLVYAFSVGDLRHESPRLLAATMATLPAVWVMAAIAIALFGIAPKFATSITWSLFALFLVLELGWEMRQISQAVFDLSPFAHVHWSHQVTATSMLALTLAAAILTVIGLLGFNRRDLT